MSSISGKEAAHALTDPEDVRLARRIRRAGRRELGLGGRGTLSRRRRVGPRHREQRPRAPVGAATYTRWAGFLPSLSGPFAAPMNEIPKVVFSNSLTSADWGETTIAIGDLADAIARLKQERADGYLLAQGGVRFARSLVETGLIDAYRLVVHPVVLGAGERLFTAPLAIEPVSTTAFSAGAVAHVSRRTPVIEPDGNPGTDALTSAPAQLLAPPDRIGTDTTGSRQEDRSSGREGPVGRGTRHRVVRGRIETSLTLTLGEAAELSGNGHLDEERARGSDEHRRVRQTLAAVRQGVAAL